MAMARIEEYRARAVEIRARALNEPNRELGDQLEKIAISYDHLAELAEKNQHRDIVYEPREEFPPSSK